MYVTITYLPMLPTFWGTNGVSRATFAPLGDCLLVVYFEIFLEFSKQIIIFKPWKTLKYFITLLCYGLHKTFAKIKSFSKKFKSSSSHFTT